MRAFLEIAVVVVLTVGLVWWIHRGYRTEANLSDKFDMTGVKIVIWIMACLLALGLLAPDTGLAIPELGTTLPYIGAAAAFLFLLLGRLLNISETAESRKLSRMRGIPPEPRMFNPWVPAILTGFVSLAVVLVTGFLLALATTFGQTLEKLAGGATVSSIANDSADLSQLAEIYTWLAGGCLVLAALVFFIQRSRRTRAWQEHHRLHRGINDRIKEALIRQKIEGETI